MKNAAIGFAIGIILILLLLATCDRPRQDKPTVEYKEGVTTRDTIIKIDTVYLTSKPKLVRVYPKLTTPKSDTSKSVPEPCEEVAEFEDTIRNGGTIVAIKDMVSGNRILRRESTIISSDTVFKESKTDTVRITETVYKNKGFIPGFALGFATGFTIGAAK